MFVFKKCLCFKKCLKFKMFSCLKKWNFKKIKIKSTFEKYILESEKILHIFRKMFAFAKNVQNLRKCSRFIKTYIFVKKCSQIYKTMFTPPVTVAGSLQYAMGIGRAQSGCSSVWEADRLSQRATHRSSLKDWAD